MSYPAFRIGTPKVVEYAQQSDLPADPSSGQLAYIRSSSGIFQADANGEWQQIVSGAGRDYSLTLTYDGSISDPYYGAVSRAGFSDWEIDGTSGELKNVDATDGDWDSLWWPGALDNQMEVKFKYVGTYSDLDLRFTLRTLGTDNYITAEIDGAENEEFGLVREVDGTQTSLSRASITLVSGTYYTLIFKAAGHYLKAELWDADKSTRLAVVADADDEIDWPGYAGVRKAADTELWISYFKLSSVNGQTFDDGFVWPLTGTTTPDYIYSPFGHRQFFPHTFTVPSDLDLHMGADLTAVAGVTPVYAMGHGVVNRLHINHFSWGVDNLSEYFTEASGSATYSVDTASAKLGVAAGGTSLLTLTNPEGTTSTPFTVRVKIDNPFDDDTEVGIQLDVGSRSFRVHLLNDGAEKAVATLDGSVTTDPAVSAGIRWLELEYTGSAVYARHSEDGRDWTQLGGLPFTPDGFVTDVGIYSNGFSGRDIDFFGYTHENSPGRFGNWLRVSSPDPDGGFLSWLIIHFDSINVGVGDVVKKGDLLGIMGDTGWDSRSGTVLNVHVHMEFISNAKMSGASPPRKYYYDNADPVNPERYLPRTNSDSNVTVSVTDTPDPDSNTAFRVRVTQTRVPGQNDFDVNELAFVGASGSQTINLNERTGVADDVGADRDAHLQGNVYIVEPDPPFGKDTGDDPDDYVIDYYCRKSHFGSSLTSVTIKDVYGTTVATWTP